MFLTLCLLILSFLTIIPTISWFQDILVNLQSYLLLAQIFFLLFSAIIYFRKRRKFYLFAALCLIVFIVSGLSQLSKFYYWEKERSSVSDKTITAYYLNMSDEFADWKKITEQLKSNQPDLILLLESPNDLNLKDSFFENYPYQISTDDLSNSDLKILSKFKFEPVRVSTDTYFPTHIVLKILPEAHKPFNLMLWHARQPLFPDNFYNNKAGCRRLATMVRNSTEAYLIAGDFNATPFSNCYKWFAGSRNLEDVFWGRGLVSTWHADNPYVNLMIDHIFYTEDFVLRDIQKLEAVGSDHFSFFVTFGL